MGPQLSQAVGTKDMYLWRGRVRPVVYSSPYNGRGSMSRLLTLVFVLACLPSALAAQKNCKKGIPCGNSCIAADKVCRVGTPSYSPPASSTSTPSRSSFAHLEPSVQARSEGVIDSLERRIAELERRLDAVVAYLGQEPWRNTAGTGAVVSKDLAAWRRLRRGMKADEVRKLLGEPEKVTAGGVTFWYYPDLGNVSFMDEKVYGWSEPQR